jgi:hypothetical protein
VAALLETICQWDHDYELIHLPISDILLSFDGIELESSSVDSEILPIPTTTK